MPLASGPVTLMVMVEIAPAIVQLRYEVRATPEAWVLPEVPVPESHSHDVTLDYLKALLQAWLARTARSGLVARNLAVRWLEEHPKVGVDPDIALIAPTPPDVERLSSLCLWKPGHVAPLLAIEVVSEGHPYKDYAEVQDKYAACGVRELWVLDPELHGPRSLGGPAPVQIWQRRGGVLERVYSGDGPAVSPLLGAHVWGSPVRITTDLAGAEPWLTIAESERKRADELERRLRKLENP